MVVLTLNYVAHYIPSCRVSTIQVLHAIDHQEKYTVTKRSQMQADVFFRPPAVMHVRANDLGCMPQFVLIGIHARPHRTYSELNGLVDVYEWAKETYGTDNVLILGDLNADYPSFGQVDKEQNILWSRKDIFEWLVTDNMATNVDENRAYDRSAAIHIFVSWHNSSMQYWSLCSYSYMEFV